MTSQKRNHSPNKNVTLSSIKRPQASRRNHTTPRRKRKEIEDSVFMLFRVLVDDIPVAGQRYQTSRASRPPVLKERARGSVVAPIDLLLTPLILTIAECV